MWNDFKPPVAEGTIGVIHQTSGSSVPDVLTARRNNQTPRNNTSSDSNAASAVLLTPRSSSSAAAAIDPRFSSRADARGYVCCRENL